jgi:putative restriction endonuclease
MGTFGVSRKFWITPNIKDRLDVIAQEEIMANPNLTQTQKEQLVKSRIGQGAFRDGLLAKWKRCCMTGCEIRPILRASHIKPWRHSNNGERLDVFNGLLLSPNMDALFDGGLISFSDNGEILYGPEITNEDLIALGCKPNLTIKFTERHAPYLEHHRNDVFGPRTKAAKG